MDRTILLIVAGISGIIFLFLLLKQPYLGIAITGASLAIVDLLPDVPYLSSAVPLVGIVTFIGYLIHKRWGTKNSAFNFNYLHIIGLVFILWIYISNPQAALMGSSRNWVLTYIQLWVLMYIAGDLLDTPKKQQTVMAIFSIFAIISAFYAIQTGSIGETIYTSTRAEGFLDNANAAARYFVVAMVFLSYLRSTVKNPWLRIFTLIGIIITYLGVFYTVSRTGMLLLVLAQGLILLFQIESRQRIRLFFIFMIALIILFFLSDTILDIFESIFPSIINREDTVGLRINLWKSGWMMWLDHPIRGVGIGRYIEELGPYIYRLAGPHRWNSIAHNTYIQILSETGIVGFILFIVLITTSLKNFWQIKINNDTEKLMLRNAWLVAFIVMLVGGITKSDHADKLTWMVMGLSLYFSKESNLAEKEETIQPIPSVSV